MERERERERSKVFEKIARADYQPGQGIDQLVARGAHLAQHIGLQLKIFSRENIFFLSAQCVKVVQSPKRGENQRDILHEENMLFAKLQDLIPQVPFLLESERCEARQRPQPTQGGAYAPKRLLNGELGEARAHAESRKVVA
eukprot:273870-Rhodomonas_salina.2